jgi:hypothetical protein
MARLTISIVQFEIAKNERGYETKENQVTLLEAMAGADPEGCKRLLALATVALGQDRGVLIAPPESYREGA